jgi:hypothetical protein
MIHASEPELLAFITEYAVVDRIMEHLRPTFIAAKPPPSLAFDQVIMMESEGRGDIIYHLIFTGRERLSSLSWFERISCPDWIFMRVFRCN